MAVSSYRFKLERDPATGRNPGGGGDGTTRSYYRTLGHYLLLRTFPYKTGYRCVAPDGVTQRVHSPLVEPFLSRGVPTSASITVPSILFGQYVSGPRSQPYSSDSVRFSSCRVGFSWEGNPVKFQRAVLWKSGLPRVPVADGHHAAWDQVQPREADQIKRHRGRTPGNPPPAPFLCRRSIRLATAFNARHTVPGPRQQSKRHLSTRSGRKQSGLRHRYGKNRSLTRFRTNSAVSGLEWVY